MHYSMIQIYKEGYNALFAMIIIMKIANCVHMIIDIILIDN